jgi:hypothetical protein
MITENKSENESDDEVIEEIDLYLAGTKNENLN